MTQAHIGQAHPIIQTIMISMQVVRYFVSWRAKRKGNIFHQLYLLCHFFTLWMVNITDVRTANTWDHMISNGKQRKFVNKSIKTSDHRFTITLISIWWPAMNEHTYANNFFHFSRIMRAFTTCRRMSVSPSARSLLSLQHYLYDSLHIIYIYFYCILQST
jgi:hypothetical protein